MNSKNANFGNSYYPLYFSILRLRITIIWTVICISEEGDLLFKERNRDNRRLKKKSQENTGRDCKILNSYSGGYKGGCLLAFLKNCTMLYPRR
jgi:hypothetical protein